MMVSTRGSVLRVLAWQWKRVLFFLAAGVIGWVLIDRGHLAWLEIPVLPMSVLGAATGIFVSFRTNACYERWWEGRQLWGRLVNASRMLATQASTYLAPARRDDAVRLVHRHIAYVHALRTALRGQDPWKDEPLLHAMADPPERFSGESNVPHAILHRQLADLGELARRGELEPERLQSFDRTLMELLDVQGGCERIKKTPLPRGYVYISERLIYAFALIFTFSLVHELGWYAIPVNVLVCLSFALISEAGRVLEDPFNLYWNALPLFALSRTIERNLRECFGETDLPEIPGPDARGILM